MDKQMNAEERAIKVSRIIQVRTIGSLVDEVVLAALENGLVREFKAHGEQERAKALREAAGALCRWCKGDENWEEEPYKHDVGEWRHRAKDSSLADQFCHAWRLWNTLMEVDGD